MAGELGSPVNMFVSPDEDGQVLRAKDRAEGPHHLGLVCLEPGGQVEEVCPPLQDEIKHSNFTR